MSILFRGLHYLRCSNMRPLRGRKFLFIDKAKIDDAAGIKMYFKNPELNYYHSDAVGVKLNRSQQVPS